MVEIKLCAFCARYQYTEHNADVRQANFNKVILDQRACSDCCEYALVSEMTTTPAGNMVCPRCSKRRAKLGAERAQLTMFGQDSLTF